MNRFLIVTLLRKSFFYFSSLIVKIFLSWADSVYSKWLAVWDCTKNHIFFFQMFWKDCLSKKVALEYDISWIIRKDDISFPRKYDLIVWAENERWSFSKKKNVEIWYLLQMFQKDSLSKKSHRNMIFLVTSGKVALILLEKIFFLGGKWKMIFLKKYKEIW